MGTESNLLPNPPYIPLMTLENFAGKLKATVVPPVIDSSLTLSMSGGMAGALMSALKFLGLIDSNGKVLEPLKKLVAAHGTETWKRDVADILVPAYSDVLGDLDMQTATPSMLEECFRKRTKASGQVLEKAVRFFLAVWTAADLPISPLLKTRKPRSSSPSRKAGRSTGARKPINDEDGDDADDGNDSADQEAPPGMRKLRLPVPGKQDLLLMVPEDMSIDDWKFLEPILKQFVERMLGADLV